MWGFDGTDVWAVGDEGVVLHYRKAGWASLESGTRNQLNRIRGRQYPNGWREIFIAGEHGTLLRYRYPPP